MELEELVTFANSIKGTNPLDVASLMSLSTKVGLRIAIMRGLTDKQKVDLVCLVLKKMLESDQAKKLTDAVSDENKKKVLDLYRNLHFVVDEVIPLTVAKFKVPSLPLCCAGLPMVASETLMKDLSALKAVVADLSGATTVVVDLSGTVVKAVVDLSGSVVKAVADVSVTAVVPPPVSAEPPVAVTVDLSANPVSVSADEKSL